MLNLLYTLLQTPMHRQLVLKHHTFYKISVFFLPSLGITQPFPSLPAEATAKAGLTRILLFAGDGVFQSR